MASLSQCFSNFNYAYQCPADLVKNADSDQQFLRGWRFCNFNKLLGEADATGLWIIL